MQFLRPQRLQRLLERQPSLRTTPSGPGEHAAWSRQVRSVVARLACVETGRFDEVDSAAGDRDGVWEERYVFRTPMRGEFTGVLRAPHSGCRGPGVLVSPDLVSPVPEGTGTGAAGEQSGPDTPGCAAAVHLARAGLVTLTLDYGIDEPVARLNGTYALWGASLLAGAAEDALAALVWLREHRLVDGGRTGLFGHRFGASVALLTALLSEQPTPLCAADYLESYATRLEDPDDSWSASVLPCLARYADVPDLYAALAPTPLQLQYRASGRSNQAVGAATDLVAAAYRAVSAPSRLELAKLSADRPWDADSAADFFLRALADPPPPPPVPAARIPFDVPARLQVIDRVDSALSSGVLTLGPCVSRLEELTRQWTGWDSVAVGSGTAALEIALRIIGVAGRTVLLPVNTFFATAAAAIHAGATVDFVDIELDGLGMDPGSLRSALARHKDVAAVITVHIAGIVSPSVTLVVAECAARGVALIEDAAHALGSRLDGRAAGTIGQAGAFSLYPTKVATSGEGGIVSLAGEADAVQARRYRDQGKISFAENRHDRLGYNWRMSELHAAVGIAHLERLGSMLDERQRLAAWYTERLHDVPGVRPFPVPDGAESNYYKYVVLIGDCDRGALKARMRQLHQVALAGEVYDTLLHEQPYFAGHAGRRQHPRAEWFASHHICLPIFPGMSRAEQERVIEALRVELSETGGVCG